MAIGVGNEIERLHSLGLLGDLLKDRTTGGSIIWATDAYRELGTSYAPEHELSAKLITGKHADVIQSRQEKSHDIQIDRTKTHAEVFTPASVCARMIDYIDMIWLGIPSIEYGMELPPTELMDLPSGKTWQDYVYNRRLELTCGEAPYLVSRYDAESGEVIELANRRGILDRKLRMVSQHTKSEAEWLEWVFRAFESVYGYEFQGDSLLIARVNLVMTFEEYLEEQWHRSPTSAEYNRLIEIIVFNIFQMDGITGSTPYALTDVEQPLLLGEGVEYATSNGLLQCTTFDWIENDQKTLRGDNVMKFDFIIGNPPYQDEALGDNGTFFPPIYHNFMEGAYSVADKVELITPARFLFNAGKTPKDWNKKMLEDEHLKVLKYEQDSEKVFPNVSIKGGVVVTYRDSTKNFGAIKTFTVFPELNQILLKVSHHNPFKSLMEIIFTDEVYKFTDLMHKEHPDAEERLSDNHAYDLKTKVFERLPDIFLDVKPEDGHDYIQIIGREKTDRVYKFIRADYIDKSVKNFNKYKVFIPSANGSGAIGEVLSTPLIGQPLIGQPLIGHTQTFLSIGVFDTQEEAEACLKYVKSKFARAMLGILKITQHNPRRTWQYVPLQDFTSASDIDWSKSIPEIDQQLYDKYGLSETERNFIETKVKEML